jgi:hypothetical protein
MHDRLVTQKGDFSMSDETNLSMSDETIVFGILLGGTAVVLFGVFMWQGGWAALTAVGLLAVLLAILQSTVMAISAGARSIRKEIVRTASLETTNAPPTGANTAYQR